MYEVTAMDMNEVIARINALAKKNKEEGLTEEELAERDKLRRIYIDSVKANLIGQFPRLVPAEIGGGVIAQSLENKG